MLPANIANILLFEEEEHLEEIRMLNLERRQMRDQSDPFSIEETHFKDLFRLNKDMGRYVFNSIAQHMHQTGNPVAVPPILRYFGALYFYATGSYQRSVGQSYQISMAQQTMSRAILEVTNAIIHQLSGQWIQFPRNGESRNAIKNVFMRERNFPGVIGCVDGTHIAMIRPHIEEHNYLNRKGFHSKNVQIICDNNLKILNVNSRYAGATHDSYIWRQSLVRRELQRIYEEGDRGSWLLGDSGYPQEPWLMTPFDHAVPDSPESKYNNALCSARNCVERCIGVLKGRFRCLLQERQLRYTPEKVGHIVNACCILHNICVNGNLDYELPLVNIEDDNNNLPVPRAEIEQDGFETRRQLVDRYFR